MPAARWRYRWYGSDSRDPGGTAAAEAGVLTLAFNWVSVHVFYGIQVDWLESVMAIRTADAEWHGDLAHGSGHMRFGSGAFDGPYDFRSRMGEGKVINPEELLGAAHAGCFSMAQTLQLTNAGFTIKSIDTTAKVHFEDRDGGSSIHRIDLDAEAPISNVTVAAFEEYAQNAKRVSQFRESCPSSKSICEPSSSESSGSISSESTFFV